MVTNFATPNTPYYPFKYLRSLNYKLNIIHGIMDDGKTFGAKLDMLDRFKNHRERSVWVMNSKVILEEELSKFTTALEVEYEEWKNFKIKKDNTNNISYGYFNNELVCYFVSISSITKTARDPLIKNLYYDEYNYLDSRAYKIQWKKFNVLLSRNMFINTIFLIGNATSLNIPILYQLNIWEVKQEWTEFKLTDNHKGIIHNFKRTLKDIEIKYEESISYAIMKKGDFSNHAFLNVYILDNNNNVVKNFIKINKSSYRYTFKIGEDLYIDLYQNNDLVFCKLSKKKNKIKFALSRDFTEDGIEYADDITRSLAMKFQLNKIYYENITIKQHLYQIIKPKIFNMSF